MRPSRLLAIFEHEIIGPPDCPILYRWTLINFRGRKVMLHRFLPNADDRDLHDHPWPFVTIVLRGGYDDMRHCLNHASDLSCGICDEHGLIVRERMSAGKIRYRDATHKHRTRVWPQGCTTLVITGRRERDWGFYRDGRWWFWQYYESVFGFAMRCEDLPKEDRRG